MPLAGKDEALSQITEIETIEFSLEASIAKLRRFGTHGRMYIEKKLYVVQYTIGVQCQWLGEVCYIELRLACGQREVKRPSHVLR